MGQRPDLLRLVSSESEDFFHPRLSNFNSPAKIQVTVRFCQNAQPITKSEIVVSDAGLRRKGIPSARVRGVVGRLARFGKVAVIVGAKLMTLLHCRPQG